MGKSTPFLLLTLAVVAIDSKSHKRGVAYRLSNAADMAALSNGVSWWYNWGLFESEGLPHNHRFRFGMEYVPMLWNEKFDEDEAVEQINRLGVRHFLVLNEPNLINQANREPHDAARIWTKFERVAARTGARIIGPQMTWGTMKHYEDPVKWMDAFIQAYRERHRGRYPRIDAIGFHWLDYGLNHQLNRMKKYGKNFWVTEMANWHDEYDGAEVYSPDKQKQQCKDMVAICERRSDVERYAWFTGRWDNDQHHTSLLRGHGVLSGVGHAYVNA